MTPHGKMWQALCADRHVGILCQDISYVISKKRKRGAQVKVYLGAVPLLRVKWWFCRQATDGWWHREGIQYVHKGILFLISGILGFCCGTQIKFLAWHKLKWSESCSGVLLTQNTWTQLFLCLYNLWEFLSISAFNPNVNILANPTTQKSLFIIWMQAVRGQKRRRVLTPGRILTFTQLEGDHLSESRQETWTIYWWCFCSWRLKSLGNKLNHLVINHLFCIKGIHTWHWILFRC